MVDYMKIIGGIGAHGWSTAGAVADRLSPAGVALAKERDKAATSLRTGEMVKEAGKQGNYAIVARQLEAQSRQQNDDLRRQMASGALSGGAAADAIQGQNVAAMQARAAGAKSVQANADNQAANNYARALSLVQQPGAFKQFADQQASIDLQTGSGGGGAGAAAAGSGGTSKRQMEEENVVKQREKARTTTSQGGIVDEEAV